MAQPYSRARKITPGTGGVNAGTGVVIACQAPGFVRLVMANGGGPLDVYVSQGTAEFTNYAIVDVDPAGTTATAIITVVD